jgi:chemotaxis regulatin CheY-phosphate phosphatase CheZ
MMAMEKEIVDKIVESVTEKVTQVVQENLSTLVQYEISRALAKFLGETQYYRGLSDDVLDRVEHMFEEINIIKRSFVDGEENSSSGMLSQTDRILESIIDADEQSTLKIIEYLEQMLDEVAELRNTSKPVVSETVQKKLDRIEELLMQSMTQLGFQDLSAQKIKRVVFFLRRMEEMVSEVYVASEMFKKSKENQLEKHLKLIRNDANAAIDNIRKSKNTISQSEIDRLLSDKGCK